MLILVAYATKYGATKGIAERIAEVLRSQGLNVEMCPVTDVGDVSRYDAFVIGSAAYYFSWLKEATSFVQRNQAILASHPVWLFSSGPIGTKPTDAQGRDVRVTTIPKQIAEITATIAPKDHHVFFGALDRSKLGLLDRLITGLPAIPFVEGDFREWAEIDTWAERIARELASVPASER